MILQSYQVANHKVIPLWPDCDYGDNVSSTVPLHVVDQPLLALAQASGPRPWAECSALFGLMEASEHLRDVLRREVTRLELSSTGFGILTLAHRAEPDPISPQDLATRLELAPQTVSDALARLELSHFVTRQRIPGNRRRIAVALTENGRTTIRQVLVRIEAVIEARMAGLSATELTTLRRTCSRLCPSPAPTASSLS